MNKILFINASPRAKGTANMLCQRIQKETGGNSISIPANKERIKDVCHQIKEAQTIVLIGPSYVNTFPGTVTELFEQLSECKEELKGKNWYGVIEGGMPYTHTHESGLKQLECFCEACQMSYKGGFILPLAPLLNGKELEKHVLAKKMVPAFNTFTEHIKKGEESPVSLYSNIEVRMPLLFTWLLSKFLSHMMDKQIRENGFDPYAPSPYTLERR